MPARLTIESFNMRFGTRALGLSVFLGIGLTVGGLTDHVAEGNVREPHSIPLKLVAGPAAKQDMVLWWNLLTLHAVRCDRTPAPQAARNLACVHAAIYDSVNAIYRTHQAYYVDAAASGAAPDAAAAAAAYGCLIELYPRQRPIFDQAFAACMAQFPRVPATEKGVELGLYVAKRLLAWRKVDGSSYSCRYCLKTGLGFWELTPPRFDPPVLPHWGRVTPFAYKGGGQLKPPGLPVSTSAAYTQAYQEVKALGARHCSARTPEQTQIAVFWSDDTGTSTPPGHWNQIAQTVAMGRGNTLAENARLFALLNISMADAGIWCWLIKFTYEFWRPETGIRQADRDGNPLTVADPSWTPLLEAPAFPAYTSGHSSFSSAGAAVLADFFGTDKMAFPVASEGLPGVLRNFSSFSAAADEAGRSRIYGGIHWQFDNVDGLASGKAIGRHIVRNYLLPAGSAAASTNRETDQSFIGTKRTIPCRN